jgi:hypothetical protein
MNTLHFFRIGITVICTFACVTGKCQKTDAWLQKLFLTHGNELLQKILAQPDTFQYQVIYTRIDRDKKNQPHFTNYYLNVDRNRYFNPASTVKLPVVLASLEKLHRMNIAGLDMNTIMLTDSSYRGQSNVHSDTSAENRFPSVAQYIRKIFLTSDNDAYNRLYEFVGQETLNQMLWDKGYKDVRITRRFVPMTEEENRHTNQVRFVQNGNVIYTQPPGNSSIKFDFSHTYLVGRAHYNRDDSLVWAPMDFTRHNNLPLEDLQQLLQSVMFPSSVNPARQFQLTDDDYKFLYQYMQSYPSESTYPKYDTTEYFDSYAKFFYKAGRRKIPPAIRIFNKPGWSYGYLTDAAYVTDQLNGIEFMLSAVIYVNADGILNDNKYEYEETGYPFFSEIYRIIYDYESHRKKKYTPDLGHILKDRLHQYN